MNVPFSKKIATKLVFYPLLFMLVLFAAFSAGFYYLAPQNPFVDFPMQQQMNLLSEKRLAVDMWFDQDRKNVEYLSKNDTIKEALAVHTRSAEASSQKLLDDMVSSSHCKMFAVLLRDGTIISSSQRELIGRNWSAGDFFAGAIAELQTSSARIFHSVDGGIIILAPVIGGKEGLAGIIYAVADSDRLAGLFRVDSGLYKTEKVELIDREGNLILTQKGFPDRRIRYNVPADEKANSVRLKDNLYFYVVPLKNAPFRLISTIDKSEVLRPLTLVLLLCAVFGGLLFIVPVFWSVYYSPKLISQPVARLINAAKEVSGGILNNVDLGRGYTGELLELKKAFESLTDELKARESSQAERLKSTKAIESCAPLEGIWNELREPLSVIAGAAERVIKSEQRLDEQSRKDLQDLLFSSKDLLLLADNICDYVLIEQKKLVNAAGPFNLCELLEEIGTYAKDLADLKEIEVIVDCEEVFIDRMVHTNRSLLKKVLLNLVNNAVKNTAAGTITILSATGSKEGSDYVEVSVADTGKGFGSDEMDLLFGECASPNSSLGLIMARKMAEILDGNIEVESLAGKGSVFTAQIPAALLSC
ncbi:MAG TPA: sensor histidine kinase [Dissulfurispiraceae bacterium]|nr:sensor histidine kinase [Dissulfurispiraceae bacterium]